MMSLGLGIEVQWPQLFFIFVPNLVVINKLSHQKHYQVCAMYKEFFSLL